MKHRDLTNQKFGKLAVIERDFTKKFKGKSQMAAWRCLCDCGNIKTVNSNSLSVGDTTSCGCNRRTSVGDISGEYIAQVKRNARVRNLKYEINSTYIWKLFIRQQQLCALSGIPLIFSKKRHSKDQTASLDRIDSTKGYVEGNVQWVHKDINLMKMSITQPRFLELCTLVTKYTGLTNQQ